MIKLELINLISDIIWKYYPPKSNFLPDENTFAKICNLMYIKDYIAQNPINQDMIDYFGSEFLKLNYNLDNYIMADMMTLKK